MARLLVALALEGEGRLVIHAWLDFNLFVGSLLCDSLSIKANNLLLIADSLHAALVKLFQSAFQCYVDSWHRWQLRLVVAREG